MKVTKREKVKLVMVKRTECGKPYGINQGEEDYTA